MAEIIQEQAMIGEQPAGESNPSVVGDLRLHEFQSHIFGNTRMLRVWLPPEYDDPVNLLRYYPVFYLNDGQNLFDGATSFIPGQEWQIDETAEALIGAGAIERVGAGLDARNSGAHLRNEFGRLAGVITIVTAGRR